MELVTSLLSCRVLYQKKSVFLFKLPKNYEVKRQTLTLSINSIEKEIPLAFASPCILGFSRKTDIMSDLTFPAEKHHTCHRQQHQHNHTETATLPALSLTILLLKLVIDNEIQSVVLVKNVVMPVVMHRRSLLWWL